MQITEYSQMTLRMSRDYGALNRLLGLIRQKCFEIESLQVHPESNESFRVQVVVFSERPIGHLLKKIKQMVEVRSASACHMRPYLETLIPGDASFPTLTVN